MKKTSTFPKNKKNHSSLHILAILLVSIFATIGLTACSDDDDDNSGGGGKSSSKVEVNGLSESLQQAYYWVSNGEMQIEFYSFDPTSGRYPSKISFLSISYDVESGETSPRSITLSSSQYSVYVALGVTTTDEGFQAETKYNDRSNPDLVINVNGNNISLDLSCTVADDANDYPLTFKYNGSIKPLPENLREY